ncbi:MAG TPA: glycosyltransferase family 25 protein [Burkholderiaceae bacterium]|nr:glycosyltransferase family 25 protein [Burkholderiaceae bacterium]HQR69741.1 glycosyltransferase family 25 protein [Burkholderiaceae bacterium]
MRALGLDAILIINVKAFVERRRHVEAQLARFNLAGEFIHDFDADEITPELDHRWFAGTELNRGQKSCALKHIDVLKRVAAHGWQHCLVLEDDVVLADGFTEGVRAALDETRREPRPYVIFIGAGGNFYTPASQREPGRRIYPAAKGRFTDSYIIGAQEAALRLARIEAQPMAKPIDVVFDTVDREAGIRCLWLEDPVVEQGSKLGVFRTSLEAAPPNWLQGLRYRLERMRRKYLYQLWR